MLETILSLIPEKLKQDSINTLVDLLSTELKKYPKGSSLARKVLKFRSDAEFRARFHNALEEGIEKFITTYDNLSPQIINRITSDRTFFENEELHKALIDALKRPDKHIGASHNPVYLHLQTIFPDHKNREEVSQATAYFLRCIAESVWLMPEFGDIYTRLFQKSIEESSRQSLNIAKMQVEVTASLLGQVSKLVSTLEESKLLQEPQPPHLLAKSNSINDADTQIDDLLTNYTSEKSTVTRYQTIGSSRITIGDLLQSKLYFPIKFRTPRNKRLLSFDEIILDIRRRPNIKMLIVGNPGTGKTVALCKLYLEDSFPNTNFMSGYDLHRFLVSDAQENSFSTTASPKRLYLDALDEAHISYDEGRGEVIKFLIAKHASTIATARTNYSNRPDVKKILLPIFDVILEVEGWDKDTFEKYYNRASGLHPQFIDLLQLHELSFTPMFAAMASVIAKRTDTVQLIKRNKPRTYQQSDLTGIANLYMQFVESWYQREKDTSSERKSVSRDDVFKCWREIARELHRARISGYQTNTGEILAQYSVAEQAVVSSILVTSTLGAETVEGFVHASLLDFFCALDYFQEISSVTPNKLSTQSILYLPSFFEINIFIRGLLESLGHQSKQRASVSEALYTMYEAHTHGASTDQKFYILRNNVMYTLGRLPHINKEELAKFEYLYNQEQHPLVRYTIGMNGIFRRSENLTVKILRACMSPSSPDDLSIRDANLFCHLYYYGDIGELKMPEDQNVDWSLTRQGLRRHFEAEAKSYSTFWLIDLITVAQLEERYGGGRDFLVNLLKHIEEMDTPSRYLNFLKEDALKYVEGLFNAPA